MKNALKIVISIIISVLVLVSGSYIASNFSTKANGLYNQVYEPVKEEMANALDEYMNEGKTTNQKYQVVESGALVFSEITAYETKINGKIYYEYFDVENNTVYLFFEDNAKVYYTLVSDEAYASIYRNRSIYYFILAISVFCSFVCFVLCFALFGAEPIVSRKDIQNYNEVMSDYIRRYGK